MTIEIPYDFTTRNKPIFVSLEIWSHNELIGMKNLGYYHVTSKHDDGMYEINGADSHFKFTINQISRLEGSHIILHYDIGYNLDFARSSCSSMA